MAGTPIPFVPPIEVTYGDVVELSPLVRRVVAENPSKYTYLGTGTYIVGHGDVAVIDPGPELESHRVALAAALAGERVRAIFVTHCHADHSPLAAWLREETGATTYAFGPHGDVETDDPPDDDDPPGDGTDGEPTVREAVDVEFVPDIALADGAIVEGPGWTMEAVHTPGHTSNHLCFGLAEERTLFTGDHVMGWSTTVVSPPDGDMRAYCASLDKLLARPGDLLYRPTHGGPITEPRPFVEAYLAHRLEREAQVLGAVRDGIAEIPAMVAALYSDVREELHKAAGRSVLAHLVKLVADGAVAVEGGGPPHRRSRYGLP
jgi:glyoxylase-like metal-dependent hydrolase (beta-lactamase superfamily II)